MRVQARRGRVPRSRQASRSMQARSVVSGASSCGARRCAVNRSTSSTRRAETLPCRSWPVVKRNAAPRGADRPGEVRLGVLQPLHGHRPVDVEEEAVQGQRGPHAVEQLALEGPVRVRADGAAGDGPGVQAGEPGHVVALPEAPAGEERERG